jgi:hypothetical protein
MQMRVLPSILAIALALAAAPALAQDMASSGAALEASMAQARADAIHPGDEALTCEQIQAEMGATMNSAEVQENTAAIGESAQRQQAMAERQRQAALGMMGTSMITGIASSFIPGMGYAQGLAMQAQMAQMQAQGAEGQRESAAMLANMQEMMPQMMRGERLYNLAQAQHCPFLEEMQQQQPQN